MTCWSRLPTTARASSCCATCPSCLQPSTCSLPPATCHGSLSLAASRRCDICCVCAQGLAGPRGFCSPGPGSLSVLGPDPDEPDKEPHTDTGVRYGTSHPQPGHTTGPCSRYPLPAPGCPCTQAAPRECQIWRKGWSLWPRWLQALLSCPTCVHLILGEHTAVQCS